MFKLTNEFSQQLNWTFDTEIKSEVVLIVVFEVLGYMYTVLANVSYNYLILRMSVCFGNRFETGQRFLLNEGMVISM
jgi:hypothetical protein